MEEIISIVKILFIILTVIGIVKSLYPVRQRLEYTIFIWKRFNIKMLFEVIGLILITIGIFIFLYVYVPILKWGWLNLFISGGGNVQITPIQEGSQSSNLFIRSLVPIFYFAFMMALPHIARIEEEIFRRGHIEWKDISLQSIKFGFMHMIAGIPVAAAIALIGVGLFYGYKYRKAFFDFYNNYYEQYGGEQYDNDCYIRFEIEKQAAIVSTTYHTLYNNVLIGFLLMLSILLI